MNTPRKHHFVPRSYLAGFTPSGSGKDKLYVLDKTSGRQWQSNPGDAGCERDFYMLEVEDGGDPTALESLFNKVETQGAEAIRAVIENEAMLEGVLLEKLTNFLGIMTVRGPAILETIDKFTEGVVKSLAWHMTASKKAWERDVKRLTADGEDISDTHWEEMRDFAQGDDYDVSMSQNFKMSTLVEILSPAAFLMARRKWTVVRAPQDGPGFICSDRPMALCWNNPEDNGPLPPAYGMPGTSVMFPVNRSLALLGLYEASRPTCDLDDAGVGLFNMWTALVAQRFVYSAAPDFVVTLKSGITGGREDFMAAIAPEREDQSTNDKSSE